MVTLSNSDLKVNVAAHGAELQNIICDGKEYLWQGDAKYWGRRSPVLFPIVGRLYDGVSKYKGGEIRMGQHGFARDMEFEVVEQREDYVSYRLVVPPCFLQATAISSDSVQATSSLKIGASISATASS